MKNFIKVFCLCVLLCSCEPVLNYFEIPPDSPIEEFTEECIKSTTGIDLDLSPQTPEKK